MSHFPDNLLAALESKECILFIGSGISQWSGLPDWESLLRGMADFLDSRCLVKKEEKTEIETIIQRGDLLTAASLCSSRMRKADLRDFMNTVFINSNPKPHEVHKIIVELGPDSFVTTNYDRLIEDAYQLAHGITLAPVNNDQPIEQAEIMKHGASRFIFTPHGRADEANTIILSREDYRTIQYDMRSVTKSLEHLFISRPVVYLGFALRDPDFLMIKDQIHATYTEAEREHFAVMPDVSEMVKGFWRDSYGINIVSYPTQQVETTDKHERQWRRSHDEFVCLLRALHEELESRAQVAATATAATSEALLSYRTVFRSAMIRFCEDIVHSFIGTKVKGATVFASFRADLSPTSELGKIDVQHRRLAVLELLDSIPSLVIIGSPGAGKTYTVQRYAGILASRALRILRPEDGATGATMKQIIPLILPMKEYGGNIEDMITQRLPRSLDVSKGLRTGLFVLIFDAINEVSQILVQGGGFSRDITSFLAKYPSNRFIFTSRAMHYVPPIALPVFELQPIRPADLESYLKSKAIASDSLAPLIRETLRNPLLLVMFVQLRERSSEIVNTPTLLRFYFEDLSHKFTAATGGNVSLMALLSPLAFRLVSEGSQTLLSTTMERELGNVLAMQTDGGGVNGAKTLRLLISLGMLVPDAEGNVGFFHQTALEYVAATELLSRYEKGSFQIGRLLDLLRWDETIILFTALLTPKQRKGVLEEISKVDIILACRAFGSAAIKDENIGLFLFDIVKEKLANAALPEDQKRTIAHAVVSLAPFCRKEVLAEWLEDESMGGSAAIALAQMGAKEFVPRIIARMLEDNMWPSLYAQALEVLADESVLSELIAKRSSDRESLTSLNIAKVIRRFESDALYSEIEKLRRSVKTKDREFAARLLAELKSERSQSILVEMLSDRSPEVRLEATDALRWADYKKDEVIARMFELLAEEECGHSAVEYLFALSDSSILDKAKRRIAKTRNTREIINLCAVLSRSEPGRVRELLFERLHNYDPSFHKDLYGALSKLPTECLLPDILGFLRVDDIHLRLTVLETLRLIDERRLPISEDDCEYLIGLWEEFQSRHTRKVWWYGIYIGELLGEEFQAVSKPILLKRLADTKYAFRVALLQVMFRMTINEGDLSPGLIEWIVSKFSIKLHFIVWPAGEIVGKVATESMVSEKLIPLLSSPNSCVRSNAYVAIKTAEHRLGRRFLREQSGE